MKQVLLYSIAPEHMLNILNGLKTVEVRKRDLPEWAKDKLARGEIVEGYGYCTKGKPYLYNFTSTSMMEQKYEIANVLLESQRQLILNGLVVVKFEVSSVNHLPSEHMDWLNEESSIHKYSCLTLEQLLDYGKGKDLYAHHIKNIQSVNMELGEFYKYGKDYGADICEFSPFDYDNDLDNCLKSFQLTKAPQSFQSVWVKGE